MKALPGACHEPARLPLPAPSCAIHVDRHARPIADTTFASVAAPLLQFRRTPIPAHIGAVDNAPSESRNASILQRILPARTKLVQQIRLCTHDPFLFRHLALRIHGIRILLTAQNGE
jgi:hypothetical protein